jgi:hypothetical protein
MSVLIPLTLFLSIAPQAPAAKPAMAKADQMICKRKAVVGSLIPARKECHTRAEWAELARSGHDAAQADADRRVGQGSMDGR